MEKVEGRRDKERKQPASRICGVFFLFFFAAVSMNWSNSADKQAIKPDLAPLLSDNLCCSLFCFSLSVSRSSTLVSASTSFHHFVPHNRHIQWILLNHDIVHHLHCTVCVVLTFFHVKKKQTKSVHNFKCSLHAWIYLDLDGKQDKGQTNLKK